MVSHCLEQADGVRRATPLLLVLVCIELSDVIFAVDSIPAVFAVTKVMVAFPPPPPRVTTMFSCLPMVHALVRDL